MFVGQKRLLKELNYLVKSIKDGNKYSILLSAPAGYGKTTLAYILCLEIGNYYIGGPPEFKVGLNTDINFLDEIHLHDSPENLYSRMDSNKQNWIFATNESALLRESLTSRCIQFNFDPYTEEDMAQLINSLLTLPKESVDIIVARTSLNPRITKNICQRLKYMGVNKDNLVYLLENVIGLDSSGLSVEEQRYMEYLRRIGGKGSLDTICNGTRLQKSLVLREIEPHLLYLNLIQINSKGRMLCQ